MIGEAQFAAAVGDWRVPVPHHRFRVYRNNMRAALVHALAVRFPMTARLAGQRFGELASDYADAERPASAVLIDYGRSFAGYLRASPDAAAIAGLADMADLENAWWTAYHAREAQPLGPASLAALSPEALGQVRLAIHPSVVLVKSAVGIASLWASLGNGETAGSPPRAAPEWVIVARPGAEVTVLTVPRSTFSLVARLMQGAALAEALEAEAERDPSFDMGAQLSAILAMELITGTIA